MHKRKPELKLIMLLRHDSEQLLFEALKAGASGYVLKSGADTNIIEACRAALLAIRSSIPRRSPRSSATTSMRLLDRGCGRIEVRWRTRHRSPGKTARRSSYHLGIGCAFSTQQAVDLACVSISHSSEPDPRGSSRLAVAAPVPIFSTTT